MTNYEWCKEQRLSLDEINGIFNQFCNSRVCSNCPLANMATGASCDFRWMFAEHGDDMTIAKYVKKHFPQIDMTSMCPSQLNPKWACKCAEQDGCADCWNRVIEEEE